MVPPKKVLPVRERTKTASYILICAILIIAVVTFDIIFPRAVTDSTGYVTQKPSQDLTTLTQGQMRIEHVQTDNYSKILPSVVSNEFLIKIKKDYRPSVKSLPTAASTGIANLDKLIIFEHPENLRNFLYVKNKNI